MAVQKEIWCSTIIEGMFADNSFMTKAFNADAYVVGKRCHIPNAGAASAVKKNRTSLPAEAKKREDTDVAYDIDEYTTDPIFISNAETIELEYDKRASAISKDRKKLNESVGTGMLHSWLPTKAERIIKTTGAAVDAHLPSATGSRKAFTKAEVFAAMNKFNAEDVPTEGRYMILDAFMYSQLLESLTEKETEAFYKNVDTANGTLGKLLTFNIYMRSKVGVYGTSGAKKEYGVSPLATDNAAGLAWHEDYVSRSKGEVKMFDGSDNPMYYGDIYSFLLRAGGSPMETDEVGVLAIAQAAV